MLGMLDSGESNTASCSRIRPRLTGFSLPKGLRATLAPTTSTVSDTHPGDCLRVPMKKHGTLLEFIVPSRSGV